jgi:hypothetical protein
MDLIVAASTSIITICLNDNSNYNGDGFSNVALIYILSALCIS